MQITVKRKKISFWHPPQLDIVISTTIARTMQTKLKLERERRNYTDSSVVNDDEKRVPVEEFLLSFVSTTVVPSLNWKFRY